MLVLIFFFAGYLLTNMEVIDMTVFYKNIADLFNDIEKEADKRYKHRGYGWHEYVREQFEKAIKEKYKID